ncbi:methyltransferase [Longispora albida]|uniref:methyltransferase n=1 Tax=Longispora albida TaxID=203523 RepID=UPI000476B578|nr:methyltransferase [Longispora albida]
MGLQEKYKTGQRLVELHARAVAAPAEFDLMHLSWDLLPGVFSPSHTASTALFGEWLPYPLAGHFLEVGSGAGVISVNAALRGCAQVTAVDVSEVAVRNTRMNAARHGVTKRVRTLKSDLFDALEPDVRFDAIFWNSSVIEPPAGFVYSNELERAIFDSGYRAHERFLLDGPERLARGGRLYLGFNSLGNFAALQEISDRAGLKMDLVAHATRTSGSYEVEFQLLALTRVS